MSDSRTAAYRLPAGLLALGLAVVGLVSAQPPEQAEALVGSDFRAGNIISDDLFYDGAAMTQAEIQGFLDSKIGACQNGACLNVLIAPVASRPRLVSSSTGNLICEAFEGGTLSAAAIIYRSQVACGISAKVILVTLQKEQGLVTNRAPGQPALDRAMGMACPDTAPCAPASLGFGNQVYEGTRQLKIYKAAKFAKQPGAHYITYHPDLVRCPGGTTINIENYATAALYNYTPYQPNAAALANLGGAGDSCSSYGNRNFWVFYNNWFGPSASIPIPSADRGPIVYGQDPSGVLWAYQGNGKGGWAPRSQVGEGWSTMAHVFGAGDFDRDGHRDVLAIDAAGGLWKYPTDGALVFGTAVKVSDAFAGTRSVFAADFNGDGTQDVISADEVGYLWLHPNTGRGALGPAVRIGNGWGIMDFIFSPGDFTGDGAADVMARDRSGNLWLYRGNGRGGWLSTSLVGTGWHTLSAIVAPGDFDGDGKQDVLGRDASGNLRLYPGTGTGSWRPMSIVGSGWNSLERLIGPGAVAGVRYVDQPGAGDLNSDGARDVLARDAAGTLYLYPGNGNGGWLPRSVVPGAWGTMAHLFGASDFNGDGTQDVISVDSAGVMRLHPVDGKGGLSDGRQIGNGWSIMDTVFSAGDFDGDGNPDIIARGGGDLWLYPGDGKGGIGLPKQIGWGWGGMARVFSLGDFDGDGLQDVAAQGGDGTLWLYPGNGFGSWQPATKIGWGWTTMNAVFSPGDFDRDGNTDVLARDSRGDLWLYPGNGKGSFLLAKAIGSGWHGMTLIR